MQDVITPEVHRFEGTENIAEAQARIAKVNARLAKAGIEDRFEAVNVVEGTFEAKEGDYPFQTTVTVDFMEFELNRPSIGYGGWTFAASVSFEEGGTLVNAVPGQDLTGWVRPEAHLCEHCGTIRNRVKSFVLRNDETGEFMQIGSSCLTLFLGVKPALWAVGWELPEQSEASYSDFTPRSYDRNLWLAISLAVSENGAGFVSKGKAREWEQQSTSDLVMDVYSPNRYLMNRDASHAAWVAEMQAKAEGILAEQPELIAEVIEAGQRVGLDSDYGMNLAVVLESETVSGRGLGILTSVVGVYAREQAKEAERKATPKVEGFLGEPKERIKDLPVTVTGLKYLDGAYGTTTLVSMRATSGHTVKWFASGVKEFGIGQELVIDATIKAHENYQGTDQTMITRAKVKN